MTEKTIKLTTSNMPLVGFGTYLIKNEDVESIVQEAFKTGYRHIDTAQAYLNEEGIGNAVEKFIDGGVLSREDIFITTKLFPGNEQWGEAIKNFEMTLKACEESLLKLKIKYIDLYLIHAPFAKELRLEQWKALIQLKEKGKVKEIGVSNYNIKHLDEIKNAGLPLPIINQIELHPWSQKYELMQYMRENGIKAEAYSSLVPLSTWREKPGQDSAKSEQMKADSENKNSIIKKIAEKYNVSEAQILLRWAVQKGIPVIPKSVDLNRMKQNIDLFSFAISDEDINSLNKLDRGNGVAWVPGDPTKFEN